ncbi:MAG: RNase P subunit p30 family protein [Candidatus Thorarchaeota archaeon]|jgi:RNase P/RNase MRP subunit p30
MTVDLNVRIDKQSDLDSFMAMARTLGLDGVATSLKLDTPFSRLEDGFLLAVRTDLKATALGSLKKKVGFARQRSALVVVQLGKTQVSNWAAEDNRVDILTLSNLSKESSLKLSTAKLAAQSGTALEIPVAPLLATTGLERSKIIKRYRECIQTALTSGMQVVLTSGASEPILMRSPDALRYIGRVLGMDSAYLRSAVKDFPKALLGRNERSLSADSIASGVEIVHRGESNEED